MKARMVLASVAVLLFACANLAAAYSILDTTAFTPNGTIEGGDYIDHGRGDINYLDGMGDYVTWAHLYEFDPPAAEILSADLTIWFTDDERDSWNPSTWDIAFGITESGDWDLGGVDTGSYSYDVGINTLADGIFQVTVASVLGDFYVDKSELNIEYAPVPEPGTWLLLGCGIAGLALYRLRNTR